MTITTKTTKSAKSIKTIVSTLSATQTPEGYYAKLDKRGEDFMAALIADRQLRQLGK